MGVIDFPIERLNEFLKGHSFVVQNPFGDGLNEEVNLTVKVQLTGIKPMISVGDWKDFIEYTLFLEGDWITLPKNIAGFDSEWLNRSLEMMEANDIEQIQLRKYQHDIDNRQFGFAYWIANRNVEI